MLHFLTVQKSRTMADYVAGGKLKSELTKWQAVEFPEWWADFVGSRVHKHTTQRTHFCVG